MKKQIKEISSGKIIVFDDVFDFGDRTQFNKYFTQNCFYRPSAGADPMLDPTHNLTMTCFLSNEDLMNIGFFDKIHPEVHEVIKDYFITRSYVISTNYQLEARYHVDQPSDLTMIYYVNRNWEKDWGGETLFTDNDVSEVEYCSMCKPGRVVIFDSTIPHRPAPPSCLSKEFRYTFVTNFVKKGV